MVLQILFYRPPSFYQLRGDDHLREAELKRINWVGLFRHVSGQHRYEALHIRDWATTGCRS